MHHHKSILRLPNLIKRDVLNTTDAIIKWCSHEFELSHDNLKKTGEIPIPKATQKDSIDLGLSSALQYKFYSTHQAPR